MLLLVGHEVVPLEFVVERGGGKTNDNFTEKVVGTISTVIPYRDLE